MRAKWVCSLGTMLVAGLAVTLLAQERPDGQPGVRGRGGPPGGGMFFGGGGGFGASRMSLLRIAEVRKELELADEQVAAIEKIEEEMREKYPSPFGGRGGPGGPPGGDGGRSRRGRGDNDKGAATSAPREWFFVQAQNQEQGRRGGGQPPSPEDRARFEQMRLERTREEKVKLAEVLLPEQMKRLTEIFVQQAGVSALADDDVAKELGISDAQRTKLVEVRTQSQEAMGAAMREMFQAGGGGGDRDANRAKMEELRKSADAKVLAVLSADQQKKFETMKGKPFAMPERGSGGPPGGPGGTRGRRGGNDN